MRRVTAFSALFLSVAMLTACGGSKEDNQTTQTRMDDIDSVQGTISDDMVDTDESTEEAPVDASAPPSETKKSSDKSEDKSDEKKSEAEAPKIEAKTGSGDE